MRTRKTGVRLPFTALLLAALTALAVAREEGDESKQGGGNGDPMGDAAAPTLPGFVYVPPGTAHPGCSWQDFNDRAQNADLKRALVYEVWGNVPPELVQVPGFYIGRYEVTNAQWKYYLDQNFKVEHECSGQENLEDIANKYVKFRGEGQGYEWKAIYALNAAAIRSAVIEADKAAATRAQEEGKEAPKPQWRGGWKLEDPDPDKGGAIARVFLPQGLKLRLYAHRVPQHWYGWCKLSELNSGREFCDILKEAKEAFKVPQNEVFERIRKLRAKDFAAYPVRDLSSAEIFDFAEWAGCHLPSEYEWERAARGDRPNSEKYTFAGPWKHNKQVTAFAWANNVACRYGPLPVDDESVHHGDSPYCARHMIGNVYEITRTFFDFHPRVAPKPPEPRGGIFNYALTAKGGSYGDQWRLMQISMRTGEINRNTLDLVGNARIDTLGFRLVKHPRPGYDLLLHSRLRLTYDRGRGTWEDPLPHAFAMARMAGMESNGMAESESPYIHVTKRAAALAFAPMWVGELDSQKKKTAENRWKQGRADGKNFAILGILRSDIPLRAGIRMDKMAAEKLVKDREEFKKLKEEYDRQQKAKKRKRRKKKGEEEEEPIVLPPKPPDPDEYERLTQKNRGKVGLWREGTVQPGEWIVVYWYGFIGLANKTKLMPPDAIFLGKPKRDIKRERKPAMAASLKPLPEKNLIELLFSTEEQPDPKRPASPPGKMDSEMWALCEVDPEGWTPRKKSKYSWHIKVNLTVPEGALAGQTWKQADDKKK